MLHNNNRNKDDDSAMAGLFNWNPILFLMIGYKPTTTTPTTSTAEEEEEQEEELEDSTT